MMWNKYVCYTSVTNCEVCMYHGCTAGQVTQVLLTSVHYLDRSTLVWFPALYKTAPGSREQWRIVSFWTSVSLLIKWKLCCINVWRWQQNFEKRMLPRYNKTCCYTSVTNCEVWLVEIGREPIMWRATKAHVTWLNVPGNMKSDVHRCTSPWSFPALVDFQRCVRNNRGFEGIASCSSAY